MIPAPPVKEASLLTPICGEGKMKPERQRVVRRVPCVLCWQAVRDEARGLTHLALLAITSQPPAAGKAALQIPDTEKRRAGLADWKPAWITVCEYNYDILERSFYFDVDSPPFGSFSAKFLGKVATSFKSTLKTTIGRVDRTKI